MTGQRSGRRRRGMLGGPGGGSRFLKTSSMSARGGGQLGRDFEDVREGARCGHHVVPGITAPWGGAGPGWGWPGWAAFALMLISTHAS